MYIVHMLTPVLESLSTPVLLIMTGQFLVGIGFVVLILYRDIISYELHLIYLLLLIALVYQVGLLNTFSFFTVLVCMLIVVDLFLIYQTTLKDNSYLNRADVR